MPRDAMTPAPGTVALDDSGDSIRILAPGYRLHLPDPATALLRAPVARLEDASGRPWSNLSLLASAHTRGGADETLRVESITAEPAGDRVEVRVAARSAIWARRDLVLDCGPDGIAMRLELEGAGALTSVTVLGGRGAMPNAASGEFRSQAGFRGVMAPAATEPVSLVRPAAVPAVLGVVGDADAGRFNAVFSPPPLAFGLSRRRPRSATEPPGGDWLGMWLRAPVRELTMTAMRYSPLDGGFLVALEYEGHTEVQGSWTSPELVLHPVASGWGVLERYRDDLVAHGFAPATDGHAHPDWWTEPIFCGWGAQCARAAQAARHPDGDEGTVRAAPAFARQDVYDEFLATLAGNGLEPGTIVIDDRWQSSYGTGEVDREHWPDLRAWIAARHAEGRRVLLWWKAWDAEGIPPEECVRDADGTPVCADPGSPAYRERLAAVITELLSPDGLDADGLKIDFTQRGPSGESLSGTPGVWGIAALHVLLQTIAEAARAARTDPLLIAHAVHPSFADVFDMVRLNDVAEHDARGRPVPVIDQLRMRHAIASRVLPGKPIDTDQWPMPSRAEWLSYAEAQPGFGVPALYYVESIDGTGEPIEPGDLARVAATWDSYRRSR